MQSKNDVKDLIQKLGIIEADPQTIWCAASLDRSEVRRCLDEKEAVRSVFKSNGKLRPLKIVLKRIEDDAVSVSIEEIK